MIVLAGPTACPYRTQLWTVEGFSTVSAVLITQTMPAELPLLISTVKL
ncbi:hypothetical protein CFter6_1769 [Collimonas fungivorans]|uniref:Uncharacterized protein n=1 Tax=Collimonas fungivorans TaxID=158899 RepID=A0A127P9H0_9BURK|nr:hypothetical protein CFter6_1769 [Collimonas fungivorans]